MNMQALIRVVCTAGIIFLVAAAQCNAEESAVRPAYCANDMWYPHDPTVLTQKVDELLEKASPPSVSGKPIAVISPHAGYAYSAPVAAAGYRCLRDHKYKRVIVLAISHRNASTYQGVDVPEKWTAYSTPLGEVPIDREAVSKLLGKPGFVSNPDVDRGEHSLEIQLPFLQRVLGEFHLVPLLVGRMSTSDYAQAAKTILPCLDEDTLLVASSDFTHYGPQFGYVPFKDDLEKNLIELGVKGAAPILNCDFDGFADHLIKTKDTICGQGPILLLLRILSMQGGAKGVRAAFDTSGHITGDWSGSVTYQSIVFTRKTNKLSEQEQAELLRLARQTITAHLNGQSPPKVDVDKLAEPLRANGACFVTMKNHGQLRGCIGNMEAVGPLYESVIHNAVAACGDFRFANNPVTAKELDQIHLEISYLTPMKLISNTDEIIVGRHGLLISMSGLWGTRQGVLLPQVAYEYGWTREDFLAQTCRKAGLSLDAWKQPKAKIYSFEAEVFGEPESKTH